MLCENCNEQQREIEDLKVELSYARDKIKNLEKELVNIDRWHGNYPR